MRFLKNALFITLFIIIQSLAESVPACPWPVLGSEDPLEGRGVELLEKHHSLVSVDLAILGGFWN